MSVVLSFALSTFFDVCLSCRFLSIYEAYLGSCIGDFIGSTVLSFYSRVLLN